VLNRGSNGENKHQIMDLQQQLIAGGGHSKHTMISKQHRLQLQEQRGLNLTVSLRNPKEQQALLSKCGCRQQASPHSNSNASSPSVFTIGPHNCRDGGAAATIQHLCLVKRTTTTTTTNQHTPPSQRPSSSFFLSRDAGHSYSTRLPDRLFRRLQDRKPQINAHQILYLATGPLDSYYAEFRSGECWWGCPDADFDHFCREWEVHRVGFGAAKVLVDGQCHLSWLVVSRDGRAAWKNLPARFHNQLSSRIASEAAPVDFCLGAGDSYFVRWLDGSSDWQLSAAAADVCERLEKHGDTITSMSLHPELSEEFVIRHRTVQQSRVV